MDYAELVGRVEELAARAGFDAAEDYINEREDELEDERAAALWLLAWSYAEPARQRRYAYELLAEVDRPAPVPA